MYLKRLDIQGFKSFADKICLEFNSGITSVVGPNGSGKSNIADAIRWVLGEQSIKTLRGARMEDVIFSGTEQRKPLGFAEVSITIDNSDSRLSIEYAEVTITRRIFRSGESEYYINKSPCRLKDIIELFMDTGIGRDGYSVVGQGRVDEILSSRSEDRRHIFEEASGIMKFKVRKLEAEKKLELTRQNLSRINDIIIELENQLVPLKQQSDTAKEYLNLRVSLKELEVNVYLDSLDKFNEKLKSFEEQYNIVNDNEDLEKKRLEEITSANSQKTENFKLLEEKLGNSRREFYDIENNLGNCSSEIKLNNEKISNLSQNASRLEGEIAEMDGKLAGLLKEESTRHGKLNYLEKQLADYTTKLAGYESQMEELLKTLDETERNIEKMKSGIMDKLDIQSDKKTQINSVGTHLESIAKRQKSIDSEVYQLVIEKDRENIKSEDLAESVRHTSGEIKKQGAKHQELVKERTESDKLLAELRIKENKLKSEIQFKTSRLKMLKEMEQNLEGYNRSVREVLQACRESRDFGKGIHGALAQLIKVEPEYELAIEMSLGGALQNIITTTEEEAKKAIDFLKANKLGRATFLPISSVNGKSLEKATFESAKKLPGFVGIASTLIEYDPQYDGIIKSLLGRVVVADTIDNAISMARRFSYGFRIVTLEGDVFNTGGSISGGSADNRGTHILSRNREIGAIEKELTLLSEENIGLEKDIKQLIADISEINIEISSLEGNIKNNELVKIRDESHLSQVMENIRRLESRIDMLKQEKLQLERQKDEISQELLKYKKELDDIEKEMSETRKIISEYQDRHKDDQSARDALHTDITDFKISVNSIRESMDTVRENAERIASEKENLTKGVNRKNAEITKNHEEIKSLTETNEGLSRIIKKYEEEKSGKTFEMDRVTEERKVLEEDMYDIVNKINEINKNILLQKEELGRMEVRKTKLEADMETIRNRMWDEYEITYTKAIELRKDIGSIPQAQKKINELRNRVKELGPVYVAAIEEYAKTHERHDFMSIQRNDMEQAIEKLQRVIQEMTSIMKKQFLEQFKLINENFHVVFKELFNGGHARLLLTDSENVLESGIDIEVQPPGKRLQNMMLLSGGERAFTAIALLFSILRLKPLPFCILDEIEAALDDANVYRFVEYIRKYTDQTQFIMVTHRKGTMEGSDMLYGVTMQEHGVSRIVSMKMGEKAG